MKCPECSKEMKTTRVDMSNLHRYYCSDCHIGWSIRKDFVNEPISHRPGSEIPPDDDPEWTWDALANCWSKPFKGKTKAICNI